MTPIKNNGNINKKQEGEKLTLMHEFGLKAKNVIRFCIVVFVLTLIITIICLLMLKYAVEGENNMPFELSQLIVVSTAEGIDAEGEENTWNFDLVQNNDIYLYISKNKNYKDTEIIKSITLNNFKIEDGPKLGEIAIYRPSEDEGKIYEYKEEYIIDNSITYTGNEFTNAKKLEVANQGGILLLRISNKNLKKYSSNEETITHNGTILAKAGLNYEDITCKIYFDMIIELVSGTKFTGNIALDLPTGNILTTGTSDYEKTDFKDIIFKRN